MANSNIGAAFTTLDSASANITFTLLGVSKTPAIMGLSELPDTLSAASLPIRLLISMDGVGEGTQMEFVTIGAGTTGGAFQMRWRITDLMLALPQTQGRGLKSVAESLISYSGKYVDMLRNNRNLATGISIVGAQVSAGIYTYPGESGTPYFGVQAVIDLLEIVS